jgi:hypothetical protein
MLDPVVIGIISFDVLLEIVLLGMISFPIIH